MKKKDKKSPSKHHIVPRSRGGSDSPHNIKRTTVLKHRAWHLLFENMLPEEAVRHIREEWS